MGFNRVERYRRILAGLRTLSSEEVGMVSQFVEGMLNGTAPDDVGCGSVLDPSEGFLTAKVVACDGSDMVVRYGMRSVPGVSVDRSYHKRHIGWHSKETGPVLGSGGALLDILEFEHRADE